jgi:hypothetical protein
MRTLYVCKVPIHMNMPLWQDNIDIGICYVQHIWTLQQWPGVGMKLLDSCQIFSNNFSLCNFRQGLRVAIFSKAIQLLCNLQVPIHTVK